MKNLSTVIKNQHWRTPDKINLFRFKQRNVAQVKRWGRQGIWWQVTFIKVHNWWIREDFRTRKEALEYISRNSVMITSI